MAAPDTMGQVDGAATCPLSARTRSRTLQSCGKAPLNPPGMGTIQEELARGLPQVQTGLIQKCKTFCHVKQTQEMLVGCFVMAALYKSNIGWVFLKLGLHRKQNKKKPKAFTVAFLESELNTKFLQQTTYNLPQQFHFFLLLWI